VLIGIVSDIHGNAPALKKAMDLMGEVDERICLGDSIREYRFSNDVIGLLRDHGFITIQGNHEEVFFSRHGERSRAAPWVDRDLMHWLQAQPNHRLLKREGKEILLVHATAWPSGGQYVCAGDREFARFGEAAADIVLYGHTHEPVVTRAGYTLVVNPGSTGEPRLRNDRMEMSCAVLNVGTLSARIICFAL
jgi:putative phosphoesterase